MSGLSFFSPRTRRGAHPVLTQLPLAIVLEGQWEAGRFRRLDLALRAKLGRALLAGNLAEGQLHELEELYRRMQHERAGKDTLASFQSLVESVRHHGINPAFPVGISPKGPLLDGAHRAAVALVLNTPTLAVDLRPSKIPPAFGREWFLAHGFSEETVVSLEEDMEAFLLATGHDTCVLMGGDALSLADLHRVVGPRGTVLSFSTIRLDAVTQQELQRRLSWVPWHDKDKAEPGRHDAYAEHVTVARVRFHQRSWTALPKTHTATLDEAVTLARELHRQGHQAQVGQTVSQNRAAWELLGESGVKGHLS